MKKLMVALVAACAAGISFGETREGEDRPNWKELVDAALAKSPQRIELPNGAKWVVEEADMAEINRLPAGGISIPGSSTLILDDTTTYFTTMNITPNCDGTIVKRGPSRLKQTSQQYLFYGKLIIEDGILERANHYLVDGGRNPTIVVKSGATLHLNYAASMGNLKIEAEGTGYNGMGAIVMDKVNDGLLPYLVLTGDTLIVQNADGYTFDDYVYPSTGRYETRQPTLLELHGHTLTIGGTSASVGFSNTVVSDDPEGLGKIVIGAAASGSRKVLWAGSMTQVDSAFDFQGDTTIEAGTWAKPLTIAEGKTLTFAPSSSTTKIAVTGTISGDGNVALAGANGGSVTFGTSNAYAGTTTISGTDAFTVSLSYGDSIPDFTKLTKTGGTVLSAPTYDESGALTWTAAQTLALNKAFEKTSIVVDVSGLTNLTDIVFTKAEVDETFPSGGLSWGAAGSGTGGYTVEGPYAESDPLRLDVSDGTVRISGEKGETNHISSLIVHGKTTALKGGTLVLDGGTFDHGNNMIYVGRNANSGTTGLGRLILTNATLQGNTAADYTTGEMAVGMWGKGVVEVEDGACLSNKFVLGGGGALTGNYGVGAIYQRGGIVAPRGSGAMHQGSCVGFSGNGHGYYALEDGLFAPAGVFSIAGYAVGLFTQTGGSAYYKSGLTLDSCNGGCAIFSILNGTTELGNNFITISGSQGMFAVTTISGPSSVLHVKNGYVYQGSGWASAWTQYNVNDGGVFWYDTFMFYERTADHYTQPYPFTLNLNGGILRKQSVNYQSMLAGNYDGTRVVHKLSKATVYEKGCTIDSNGFACNTSYTPLEGAAGGGLKSVTLTESQSKGWIAPPYIQISGDGYGASAIALLDTRTSTITNVLVTCPGWGYTQDGTTVKLIEGNLQYGVKTTLAANQFEIVENEVGGFTKMSDGVLTVYNTNTWAKWTRVLGGTLKAGCDKAIPSGTFLTLSNGATLDLNNVSDATFTGVDGTGGTGTNGTVKIVGEWKVSAKKFIDRETTAVVGTLDLTECTGITLVDTEVLDDAAMTLKRLDLFTATEVLGLEDVEISGAPKDWRFTKTQNGLRLAPPGKGLLMIIGSNSGSSSAARETVRYDGADVEIVVAANAPKTVKFAASELQNF